MMVPVTDIPEGETTPNPEQTPRPKPLELPPTRWVRVLDMNLMKIVSVFIVQ